jgi:hypothetical protein
MLAMKPISTNRLPGLTPGSGFASTNLQQFVCETADGAKPSGYEKEPDINPKSSSA